MKTPRARAMIILAMVVRVIDGSTRYTLFDELVKTIKDAERRERIACMAAIRSACNNCDDGHTQPHGDECQYCGEPLQAIRNMETKQEAKNV